MTVVNFAPASCLEPQLLVRAEFTTLRLRLNKISARIVETASRVRVAFAAAHPEAQLLALSALAPVCLVGQDWAAVEDLTLPRYGANRPGFSGGS